MEALGAHPQRERRAVLGWSRTGGKNLRAADLRVRAQVQPRQNAAAVEKREKSGPISVKIIWAVSVLMPGTCARSTPKAP